MSSYELRLQLIKERARTSRARSYIVSTYAQYDVVYRRKCTVVLYRTYSETCGSVD